VEIFLRAYSTLLCNPNFDYWNWEKFSKNNLLFQRIRGLKDIVYAFMLEIR